MQSDLLPAHKFDIFGTYHLKPLGVGVGWGGFLASLTTAGFYRYVKEKSKEESLLKYRSELILRLEDLKRKYVAEKNCSKALSRTR